MVTSVVLVIISKQSMTKAHCELNNTAPSVSQARAAKTMIFVPDRPNRPVSRHARWVWPEWNADTAATFPSRGNRN